MHGEYVEFEGLTEYKDVKGSIMGGRGIFGISSGITIGGIGISGIFSTGSSDGYGSFGYPPPEPPP